jgi:hypothetical protein
MITNESFGGLKGPQEIIIFDAAAAVACII